MERKQIMSLLVIVGALIAVVGIFLSWFEWSVTVPLIGTETTKYTGWELITDGDLDFDGKIYVTIAFVLALIVLIGALINLVGVLPDQIVRYSSLLLLILGLLTAVMAIVFFATEINKDVLVGSYGAGIGLWLAVVGGILIAIPSILAMIDKE